jgi:ubiquinone/menaquinone biosynthesis C-methylase UbiE
MMRLGNMAPRAARWLLPLPMMALLLIAACGEAGKSLPPKNNLIDTTLSDVGPSASAVNDLSSSLDNPERENWQKPQVVISLLGDLSDKTVADIGAGTGYFSFRLAQKAERVIAIDIDSLLLDYIDHRVSEGRQSEESHLETRLTTPDDPGLKPQEADIILLVNTYHLLSDRPAYFQKVKACLKPGGKVVVIDFKRGRMPVGPPQEDRISPTQAAIELAAAGLITQGIDSTSLDYQYILTAK